MRLYESLSYLNNNNNNNYEPHANDTIDRLSRSLRPNGNQSSVNTVKTFTSNGNQQSNSDSDIIDTTATAYFEIANSIANATQQPSPNWQFETEFNKALTTLNETNCFYGSHRKLKSRNSLELNDDDNANGNDALASSIESSPRNSIDLIDDGSSDIEAELNDLINRSNLCRQNFEYESHKEIGVADTEQQLMDEEDEFSSLSISTSLSAEKRSYPRGIINPNYPGFQHLAHTLTEHFVDPHNTQHTSMSDSDFSEVDSDFPSEGHSIENAQTIAPANNDDDSNGNNIIELKEQEKSEKMKSDNLSTVEEILRTVFESNSCHLTTAIEMFTEKELAEANTTDIDESVDGETDVNACDLKTYLDHYEDGGININAMKTFKTPPIASPVIEPDVVRKSSSCECGFEPNVDKPDILLDVADDNVQFNNEKDEPGSAWSITPVDIVGNFEQEVERELGLLVTGYRNKTFRNECDAVDGPAKVGAKETNEEFFVKTTDATLSNANDTISTHAAMIYEERKHSTDDELLAKHQIPTAIVKPKYQKSSFDDRQLPTVAHMNDDKMAWYDKTITSDAYNGSTPVAMAPTKKIHLPEFERKAKKHVKSSSSSLGTTAATAAAIPPTMTSATATTAPMTSSAKSAHNNHSKKIDNTECASDGKELVCRTVATRTIHTSKSSKKSSGSGASVAVVQPRKKERMDERKLMETIVQMQIKKNALLYRGQGNNNKSNTITTTTSPNQPQANHSNNNPNHTQFVNNNNNKHKNHNVNVNINNNNNNSENCTNVETNQAKKDQKDNSGCFDVYNIETALPVIDLETIENHLKLVEEDKRRKRNDREEIRRRLAMGAEDDYLTKISTAKPGRKPSLQSRLQEGKNLQICFVNDAAVAADGDSLSSDSESCPKLSKPQTHINQSTSLNRLNNTTVQPNPYSSRPLSIKKSASQDKGRTTALTLDALKTDEDPKEIDFFTKQARLQIEARMALAQAKDIAHMQMEMERQKQMESPITGMIRSTIEKVGYHFPAEKRRVSRQMLTDMNVAQLQIIVNEFHTQIESLNEQLVKYLMDRDDLHMGQDSMLVDIEDLTRYLGAKKDPYSERKKPTKKYHSMKSPKYMVSQKIQPQHRLASQIGKS